MTEAAEVQSLEQRVAGLESQLHSILTKHTEFEKVHVSRRGVQGIAGPKGDIGSVGPSANPKEVAEMAAELVKKSFRFETFQREFESLLKDLESQLVVPKVALRVAIIDELR